MSDVNDDEADSLQPLCMGVPQYCGNWESGGSWDEVGIGSSLFYVTAGWGNEDVRE